MSDALAERLTAVLKEYDEITAIADEKDAEWDFVMRAADWRVIRAALREQKEEG